MILYCRLPQDRGRFEVLSIWAWRGDV